MNRLAQHIESLIFISEHPITLKEIRSCLQEAFDTKFSKTELELSISSIIEKYQEEDFSIEVVEVNDGFKFMSKGIYHNTVATYLKQTTKKKLSRAALETLAIIAYKQPIEKSEMEKIRGVSCNYSVQKLLEKELVEIVGRSEGPGKPLLYGTSEKFMDYFGLKNLNDLPKLREIAPTENSIGDEDVEVVTPAKPSSEEE